MMELEVNNNVVSGEAVFEVEDLIDTEDFDNEKCGICMDFIIDRGVLDCCQHWFCFACIDNWATITNLCPLCQNEFQLITCVPVYDTIGSRKIEEDSFSRDDDWCIQGKNNTLSFPSYYIDENAVICLDGDGCKIRSGLATAEDDSNLDTSIACDSCDVWYHAFCVGFDPEGSSENSWLCPRCVIVEMPQKSNCVSIQRPSSPCFPENAGCEYSVEAAFSGKVSVSIADAGETAIVVSMVEGKHQAEDLSENFMSVLEVEDRKTEPYLPKYNLSSVKLETLCNETTYIQEVEDRKTECYLPKSNLSSLKLETQCNETTYIPENTDAGDTSLVLSLSRDTPSLLPCSSLESSALETSCVDKANGSDECKVSSAFLNDKPLSVCEPSESESSINLHLGLSVGFPLSVDKIDSVATENRSCDDIQLHNPSEESPLSVDWLALDANEDVEFSGVKRKCSSVRDDVQMRDCAEGENSEGRAEMETELPAKKARFEGKCQMKPLNCQITDAVSDGAQKFPHLPAPSKDDKLRNKPEKDVTLDIMSIVKGTDRRFPEGPGGLNSTKRSSKLRENAAGLRVKKIMPRASEDKESSMLVQKLRTQIREAVRNKTEDFDKNNLFDPKLLAAFRATIAGPKTETIKTSSPSVVKMKKNMLQKGKIRESLTRKIYGTNSGKRRRAWDRDCEIEFWKHRCITTSKAEKVETLKSVLDLLRKSSQSAWMENGSEEEAANPFLSRLYLADASVFPRKDDIKPFSSLTSIDKHEQNKQHNLKESVSQLKFDNNKLQTPSEANKSSPQVTTTFDNKVKKSTSRKLQSDGPTNGPDSISPSGGSKVKSHDKELFSKSHDVKSDKRKWALEVLARKNATVEKVATQRKEGDNFMLKGNYPLLAQLPPDMRPILAPSRHNKVPLSVRQAQLYRLTEHFLRKVDMPVNRRTADTELAVADAVNIEKDVADRSNSKLVYVNLCSHVLSQHTNKTNPSRAIESNSSPPPLVPIASTEPAPVETNSDPIVDEALRLAGLLSDSPPNSPYHPQKDHTNIDNSSMAREEGPENIFDIDSQPELDIYGDFEYDLEDEDYIGPSAVSVSKLKPEEGDSKMKVVFSTLNLGKSNEALNCEDHEQLVVTEAPVDPPCLLESHKDGRVGSPTLEVKIDAPCLPPEILQGEGEEEPFLVECEELYGPDKEPLVNKLPQESLKEENKLVGEEVSASDLAPKSNKAIMEFEREGFADNNFIPGRSHVESSGGENSPNHSLTSENVRRKEVPSNNKKQPDLRHSIHKKVEVYIKEHIRPLCKSGVISVEQYRWAVERTTDKVMKYHFKAKNADFLIKEGEKVKKLALQYVETAKQKKERK